MSLIPVDFQTSVSPPVVACSPYVHCAPEAAVGGPIALVHDGDEISFDLLAGNITLHVNDEELAHRRQTWIAPVIRHARGYLADFAATVAQANHGCVSRAMYPSGY